MDTREAAVPTVQSLASRAERRGEFVRWELALALPRLISQRGSQTATRQVPLAQLGCNSLSSRLLCLPRAGGGGAHSQGRLGGEFRRKPSPEESGEAAQGELPPTWVC